MRPGDSAVRAARILRAIVVVGLVISLTSPMACAQVDEDDQASAGEWIFFVTLTTIVTACLVLLGFVWPRRMNPYTRLPSRVRPRRARGPIRKGPLH